jgi:general secretion pathway protein G
MIGVQQKRSKITDAANRLSFVKLSLETFHTDLSRWPTSEEGIQLLTTPIGRGPYLEKSALYDPWGRELLYELSSNGTVTIRTLGEDGVQSGDGENTDLSVRVK